MVHQSVFWIVSSLLFGCWFLIPYTETTYIKPSILIASDIDVQTSQHRKLHLIAFSSRIIRESCVSMETALLSGWSYNLLTKFTAPNASRAGANGEKTLKLYAYQDILDSRHVAPNDLIIFVDAYDVIFQGNIATFVASISGNQKHVDWDLQKTLVYNAEDFCHPFVCCSASYRCPLTQGVEYLKNPIANNTPYACQLQIGRAPLTSRTFTMERGIKRPVVFLNSGVSLGMASVYKKFIDHTIDMVTALPPLCHDDQGVVAWMYAKEQTNYPVTLDYTSTVLATTQVHVLKDYKFDNVTGVWKHRNGAKPSLIHFAGSKRAYNAYRKALFNWHRRRLGGTAAIKAFFRNQTVTVDGVQQPFYNVCPEEHTSLWNSFINGVDTVLKRTGLSPIRQPPAECPPEFCPRHKTGPLPDPF